MAFHWRADDGPTLNASLVSQEIRTSNVKKPYISVFFRGGGGGGGVGTPCPPSSEPAHAVTRSQWKYTNLVIDESENATK